VNAKIRWLARAFSRDRALCPERRQIHAQTDGTVRELARPDAGGDGLSAAALSWPTRSGANSDLSKLGFAPNPIPAHGPKAGEGKCGGSALCVRAAAIAVGVGIRYIRADIARREHGSPMRLPAWPRAMASAGDSACANAPICRYSANSSNPET